MTVQMRDSRSDADKKKKKKQDGDDDDNDGAEQDEEEPDDERRIDYDDDTINDVLVYMARCHGLYILQEPDADNADDDDRLGEARHRLLACLIVRRNTVPIHVARRVAHYIYGHIPEKHRFEDGPLLLELMQLRCGLVLPQMRPSATSSTKKSSSESTEDLALQTTFSRGISFFGNRAIHAALLRKMAIGGGSAVARNSVSQMILMSNARVSAVDISNMFFNREELYSSHNNTGVGTSSATSSSSGRGAAGAASTGAANKSRVPFDDLPQHLRAAPSIPLPNLDDQTASGARLATVGAWHVVAAACAKRNAKTVLLKREALAAAADSAAAATSSSASSTTAMGDQGFGRSDFRSVFEQHNNFLRMVLFNAFVARSDGDLPLSELKRRVVSMFPPSAGLADTSESSASAPSAASPSSPASVLVASSGAMSMFQHMFDTSLVPLLGKMHNPLAVIFPNTSSSSAGGDDDDAAVAGGGRSASEEEDSQSNFYIFIRLALNMTTRRWGAAREDARLLVAYKNLPPALGSVAVLLARLTTYSREQLTQPAVRTQLTDSVLSALGELMYGHRPYFECLAALIRCERPSIQAMQGATNHTLDVNFLGLDRKILTALRAITNEGFRLALLQEAAEEDFGEEDSDTDDDDGDNDTFLDSMEKAQQQQQLADGGGEVAMKKKKKPTPDNPIDAEEIVVSVTRVVPPCIRVVLDSGDAEKQKIVNEFADKAEKYVRLLSKKIRAALAAHADSDGPERVTSVLFAIVEATLTTFSPQTQEKLNLLVRLAKGDLNAVPEVLQASGVHLSGEQISVVMKALAYLKRLKAVLARAMNNSGGGFGETASAALGAVGDEVVNQTLDQLTEIIFDKFDSEGRGLITFPAFQSILGKLHLGIPETEARAIFVKADVDHMGSVDKREWRVVLLELMQVVKRKALEELGLTEAQMVMALVVLLLTLVAILCMVLLGVKAFSDGGTFSSSISGMISMLTLSVSKAKTNMGAIAGEIDGAMSKVAGTT